MFARAVIVAVLVTGACGCGVTSVGGISGVRSSAYVSDDANYIRFEHAFTDAAAEEVRQRAEKICGDRKQAAIKTTSACTLSKCTTHYQCTGAK
jgi:hypothetical protein